MAETHIKIVVRIEAKADKVDQVKSSLAKLVAPTQAEAGCIEYHLYQDHDNPAVFVFLETWQSNDALQAHMQSQHIQQYTQDTAGDIADFSVNKLALLG